MLTTPWKNFMFTADIKNRKIIRPRFRRQGKLAGRGMEIINYTYNDRRLVADKNIDEVLEQKWSRLGSNIADRGNTIGQFSVL